MTLPSSGPLSMNDIAGEFGGSTPHALNEYYAGGGLVPAGTSGTYGAVPSSGTISIQNFYGTSAVILPGVPSSLVYTTTSPTTLAAVIGNPATGSPFTQYRITTTPTTSTTTSSTPTVCISNLSSSTAYTITGSVSNSGGYGPGLTSSSFTTAGHSWTTTGWGLFGSANTFTSGIGPYVGPGATSSCAHFATTTSSGSFYVHSGEQYITGTSTPGAWVARSDTSGPVSWSRMVSGFLAAYGPSLGTATRQDLNTVMLVSFHYTSSGVEAPNVIGFTAGGGTTTWQKFYVNASDTTQGMRVLNTSMPTGPSGSDNLIITGRLYPGTNYPGFAGGAFVRVNPNTGFLVNSGGYMYSSQDIYTQDTGGNSTYVWYVGYDVSQGLPLRGFFLSNVYNTFNSNRASFLGPYDGTDYNWMYFFAMVPNRQTGSNSIYVMSTIASNSSGGGDRRVGISKHLTDGTQEWIRTLSAPAGASLYPARAMASDTSGNVYISGQYPTSGLSRWFIAKYNSSGTLQWQREFLESGTISVYNIASIALEDTSYLSIEMQASGTPARTAYCRIPTDGTKTGNYMIGSTAVLYQPSSWTSTTESYTFTSAPSVSIYSTLGWSDDNSSLTIADAGLTVQAVTI